MSPKSQPKNDRCTYRSTRGRRCRSLLAEGHDSLCMRHWRRDHELDEQEHRSPEALAIVSQVLGTREQFKTATQVNDALAKVFALRGRKLISIRDATLFAYLSQLMLFSLSSVEHEFTRAYEYKEWERLIDRALRAHTADLPPLSSTNPPAPEIVSQIPSPAASISVGAPSFPSGKGGEVDVDLAPASKHLLRKRKRRPLPRTGREFAMQVFDKLAEDRAARKQRTEALAAEEAEPVATYSA